MPISGKLRSHALQVCAWCSIRRARFVYPVMAGDVAAILQQDSSGAIQCPSQSFQVVQAEVAFAAFDSADIGAVQAAAFRQLLLTPAVLQAQPANVT